MQPNIFQEVFIGVNSKNGRFIKKSENSRPSNANKLDQKPHVHSRIPTDSANTAEKRALESHHQSGAEEPEAHCAEEKTEPAEDREITLIKLQQRKRSLDVIGSKVSEVQESLKKTEKRNSELRVVNQKLREDLEQLKVYNESQQSELEKSERLGEKKLKEREEYWEFRVNELETMIDSSKSI